MEDFNQLSTNGKIEAILAAAFGPMTEEDVLSFMGVDSTNAPDVQQIRELLRSYTLKQVGKKSEALYGIDESQKDEVIRRLNIEIKSVHDHIANAIEKKINKARNFQS